MELFNQYKTDLTTLIEEIEQKMKKSVNLIGGDSYNILLKIELRLRFFVFPTRILY
jgi:hypothetical protein